MGEINPAAPSALLARLFDARVATAEMRCEADPALLYPQEAVGSARFSPKRRAEYAAGRACARRALEQIGISGFPVVSNADRSPRWPPQIVGSITHTQGFCGSVAVRSSAFAGIGIDAELIGRVTPDIESLVFTPHESAFLASCGNATRESAATIFFSAKEAFYKCQFTITGRWLDFQDAVVTLRTPINDDGVFELAPSPTMPDLGPVIEFPLTGRFAFEGQFVATGIAVEHKNPVASCSQDLAMPRGSPD
jgi:4'-phosphopantetheinyl transferase EntD